MCRFSTKTWKNKKLKKKTCADPDRCFGLLVYSSNTFHQHFSIQLFIARIESCAWRLLFTCLYSPFWAPTMRHVWCRLLGKYEIGRVLGEGAFGLVFEAKPVGSDRRVALKQINKQGVRREEMLRGEQEPGVADIFSVRRRSLRYSSSVIATRVFGQLYFFNAKVTSPEARSGSKRLSPSEYLEVRATRQGSRKSQH